jgi:hypothetical protein
MRGIISKSWCKKLAGPEGQRDRKGGQGVRREAESERHEEKDRAVIKGGTSDEPVGQRWEQVESALWGRRQNSFSPSQQGVCGRHDPEELSMTPGELAVLSHRQRHKRSDKSKAKRGVKHGEWSDCRIVPKKGGESRSTARRRQPGVGLGKATDKGRRKEPEGQKSKVDRRERFGRNPHTR